MHHLFSLRLILRDLRHQDMGVGMREVEFNLHFIFSPNTKGHNSYDGVNVLTKSQGLIYQPKYSFLY